ncbi:endonuclease III domain-containing protein [Virgibacillus ihumii]|uniref:endonuclease III domain-containing protein n=1 Tax=Virgibacillus ihumii TaxID=2686091 RepID=UPI00157C5D45|nr:endonuclease III domain-containing protein [Virgibacillus ihumii]
MHNYNFIYKKLYEHYGPQGWWPADTAFEMMIGSILVQNTNWRNAEKAVSRVKDYLKPEIMDYLPENELAERIRPSGFFNIKAQRVKSFLEWFRRYDYDVRQVMQMDSNYLRQELLNIKGIGSETADVMLLYAFDKPIFVTDAYARRIFYRFGYDMPETYDGFRSEVEKHMSNELNVFQEYHALLVEHAKQICKKRPLCEVCPLNTVGEQRLN